MRAFLFFFILIVFSCTVVQESYFNRDKSGSVVLSMSFESMDAFKPLMGEDFVAIEEDEATIKKENKDTSFVMFDIVPDSIRDNFDQIELLKKIKVSVKMDESKPEFSFSMAIDFDNVDQIEQIVGQLSKTKDIEGVDEQFADFDNFLHGIKDIEWKDNYIRIPAFNMSEEQSFKELHPGGPMFESEAEKSEMLQIFSGIQFKSIYHFPGLITSCECPNASYSGKTLTVIMKLSDYLEAEEIIIPEMKVKFK